MARDPSTDLSYQFNADGSRTPGVVQEVGGAAVSATNPLPIDVRSIGGATAATLSTGEVQRLILQRLDAILLVLIEGLNVSGDPEAYRADPAQDAVN